MMLFKADYNMVHGRHILTCESEAKVPVVGLWSVWVSTPHKGVETHYVLTDTEEHAIMMARCAMRCSEYELPDEMLPQISVKATRLPLTIQGWGVNKF